VSDALGLVDRNANEAGRAAALHRHFDDFHTFGSRYPRGDCFDLGCHFVLHFPTKSAFANKKVGFRPLT